MLRAYSNYWNNFFNFAGRSTRSDYWWVILVNVIIGVIFNLLFWLTAGSLVMMVVWLVLAGIWGLINIIPSLALLVRRMRDANFHWAFIFLGLIPAAGGIILFVFTLLPSKDGDYNIGAELASVAEVSVSAEELPRGIWHPEAGFSRTGDTWKALLFGAGGLTAYCLVVVIIKLAIF